MSFSSICQKTGLVPVIALTSKEPESNSVTASSTSSYARGCQGIWYIKIYTFFLQFFFYNKWWIYFISKITKIQSAQRYKKLYNPQIIQEKYPYTKASSQPNCCMREITEVF